MKITIYIKDQPKNVRTKHIVEKIETESEIYGDYCITPKGSEFDTFDFNIIKDTILGLQSLNLSYSCDDIEMTF
jgi:hypothetical protein